MVRINSNVAENQALQGVDMNGNGDVGEHNSRSRWQSRYIMNKERFKNNKKLCLILVILFGVLVVIGIVSIISLAVSSSGQPSGTDATVMETNVRKVDVSKVTICHTTTTESPTTEITRKSGDELLDFSTCGLSSADRIHRGREASLSQFPWMALLFNATGHVICGGTLISEQYVLTAAHCADYVITVRLGEHNITSEKDCADILKQDCAPPAQNFNVTKSDIIAHKFYSPSKMSNDIALIKLPSKVDPADGRVLPICLPYGKFRDIDDGKNGTSMTISGWGHTTGGNTTDVLMYAKVTLRSPEECRLNYQDISPKVIFEERTLCAVGINNQNHCFGDSGGPLQFYKFVDSKQTAFLHGVMAFGDEQCSSKSVFGAFMKVPYYIDWILNNMKE